MRQRFARPIVNAWKLSTRFPWTIPVRLASTGPAVPTSPPSSSIPSTKALFQFLFDKPNVGLRKVVPLSEEQLGNFIKRRPLSSRVFYNKFSFGEVKQNFNADSKMIRQLCNVSREVKLDEIDRAVPKVGSIIEAYLRDETIVFGVVIEPLHGKFNEEMNSIKVFTVDGLFIKVRPSDITLHIPNFYNENVLLQVLQSSEKLSLLQQVQYSMILFVHYCMETDKQLDNTGVYDALYLKLSSNSSMRYFSLKKAAAYMESAKHILPNRSLINFALVFLAHFHTVNDPAHFIFYKPPLHFELDSNNTIQPHNLYFAIPRFTSETITKIAKMGSDSVRDFQNFVLYMYEDSLNTRTLGTNVVNVLYYKKNNYQLIFLFLYYYIKHPHPELEIMVSKFLNENSSVKRVADFLKGLYLYDPETTDELLSSRLYGNNRSFLSLTKVDEILPKDEYNSISFTDSIPNSSNEIPYVDHFQNLRKDLTLDRDDIKVFALPTDIQGVSELAFSMFKKNSRDWIFNFHLPDIGSCVSPHSADKLFTRILKRPFCDDLNLPNKDHSYLPVGIKHFLQFKDDDSRKNCFTVSFTFNKRDPEKSWSSLKPTIRLDTIQKLSFLNKSQLSYCMGRMNPLVFSQELSEVDLRPVGELVQMLNTRRSNRRKNKCLDPSFSIQKIIANEKELSFESVASTDIDQFWEELYLIIDTLSGKYCQDADIPAYYRTQDFIADVPDCKNALDRSVINPLSKLSPTLVDSFETINELRHFSGSLSASAFFWCLEFLDAEKVHFTPPALHSFHKYHGLDNSVVRMSKPLQQLEQLINQWQLLKHLYRESPFDESVILFEGYSLNNFNTVLKTKTNRPAITLESFYKNVLEEKKIYLQNLMKRSKIQWTIKYLKRLHGVTARQWEESCGELKQSFKSEYFPALADDHFLLLKCVVTKSGSAPLIGPAFTSVYCTELGIEAEILLLPNASASIGDRMICTTIVYLDEIEERLILM